MAGVLFVWSGMLYISINKIYCWIIGHTEYSRSDVLKKNGIRKRELDGCSSRRRKEPFLGELNDFLLSFGDLIRQRNAALHIAEPKNTNNGKNE